MIEFRVHRALIAHGDDEYRVIGVLKGHGFHGLLKNSGYRVVLKGHGFIRAGKWFKNERGFRRRGMVSRSFSITKSFFQQAVQPCRKPYHGMMGL
jgi:hypothetical protein